MVEQESDDNTGIVTGLVEAISPLLAGQSPGVQGAVLGDLVAMYFAGQHPSVREQVITLWIDMMRSLVGVNAAMILEMHGGQWPTE